MTTAIAETQLALPLGQPLGPYFPPGTKRVGKDTPPKALVVLLGPSGEGKSHSGKQLVESKHFGPEEVTFIASEDVESIYGEGAHVRPVERFEQAITVVKGMLEEARKGRRLPLVTFVDSISGLSFGTQRYFRENPEQEWNEKLGKMVTNGFAAPRAAGTGMIDLFLLLQQLPGIKVALCTTWENPNRPGAKPELAVEGNMIPKFLTQMGTCAFYIRKSEMVVAREAAEQAQKAGTLYQPHRIVVPWKNTDETVTVIERYLYMEGGGEVLCKGHHALGVKEKADFPSILMKIMGKEAK